jgi:hypothetical protein
MTARVLPSRPAIDWRVAVPVASLSQPPRDPKNCPVPPTVSQVATLGWITPDTSFLQLQAENIIFGEVVPAVRRCIQELKAEHPDVDLVIGMSHTGGGQLFGGFLAG